MQKKNDKVVIAFYDVKKRILLQDRHGYKQTGEKWGFFGGSIEAGETREQALKREIKEELSIDLPKVDLLITYKVFLPEPDVYNEINLYIGFLSDTEIQKLQQKEGKAMHWFPITEAKQLIMNRTDKNPLEAIEHYLQDK